MPTSSAMRSSQDSRRRSVHFPASMQDDTSGTLESSTTSLRRGSDSSYMSSINEDGSSLSRRGSLSKKGRVKKLGHQLKILSKRAIGRSTESLDSMEYADADDKHNAESMLDSSVMEHSKDFQREHKTMGEVVQDKLGLVKHAAQVVLHPRHGPQEKAAGIIPVTEHPYVDEEADLELIQAEKELKNATVAPFSKDEAAWEVREEKQERFDKLQHERQARQDAWMLGKHVDRVRTVPLRLIDYPIAGDFNEYDSDGDHVRWQWERYFGHLLLYISQGFTAQYVDDADDQTFRRDTLLRVVERLLIASAYWQNYFMHIRKVYLWEDKINSAKWLVAYFFCLKTGYIMTSGFLWIIYITVKNKLAMDDVRFLRESHERAHSNMTPQKLSELVNRHGGEGWIDPLLDELGPTLQQQLGDTADFLEIIWNFYTWKKPRLTIYTLVFFFTCATVAALTSSEFGSKIIWWVMGMYFFFSRPIASHYSKYRKVVSLPRWLFWNIPTNAELAMDHLREEAQVAREAMIAKRVEKEHAHTTPSTHRHPVPVNGHVVTSADGAAIAQPHRRSSISSSISSNGDLDLDQSHFRLNTTDILSFRGTYNSLPGHLIISTAGLRFVKANTSLRHALKHAGNTSSSSSEGTEVVWSHTYTTLLEMRKTLTATKSNPLSKRNRSLKTNALVLEFVSGASVVNDRSVGGRLSPAINGSAGTAGTAGNTAAPVGSTIRIVGSTTGTVGNTAAPTSNTVGTTDSPTNIVGTTAAPAGSGLHQTASSTYIIGDLTRRDEAFNAIIGASGLKFQELAPLPGEVDGMADGGVEKGGKKGGVLGELGKL